MLNTTRVIGRMLNSAPNDVTGQYSGRSIWTDPFNTGDDVMNPDATAVLKRHEASCSQNLSHVAGEVIG